MTPNAIETYSEERLATSVAVIGMAGRFPGARDLDQFWDNISRGVESISFFDLDEIDRSIANPAKARSPQFVTAAAMLDDIEMFDASFFGYTPRDAEVIDPQHRLFLECAWQALEHAGYDAEQYKGWIGIWAGTSLPNYLLHYLYRNRELRQHMTTTGSLTVAVSNNLDYLATRVAYKLNLKGPSMTLQTACSTSLVAIHQACHALLSYQCDMALAGGVSVRLPQKDGYWYQEGGMVSPDGHCRAFDARAKGTIFSSGLGIVVLKRLSDALADGDSISAVILRTAVNNDGSHKVGFTAPSVDGQTTVIAMVQDLADVDPATISYVEAHGTGTALGDPIEVAALSRVFQAKTQQKQFCAIGSVKTNIGHTNTAAGVAGVIKTVLALQHGQIPPSLNYEQPNPKIDFANSPFYVNTQLKPWERNGGPRRAAVNSFGVGGTNAHALLEEAPTPEPSGPSRGWQLITISARSEAARDTATQQLAHHLQLNPQLKLADAAYTLHLGRRPFNHRRVVVARDRDEALAALSDPQSRQLLSGSCKAGNRPVVFMFSGQGAQYVGMGHDLYQQEPVFRQQLDRCAELLLPHLGQDLRVLLYPSEEQHETAARQLGQTLNTQLALFALEYALAQLWMSWGIQPDAMIGHSIGEYVAACLAGVFSLDDVLQLVALRGRLMQSLPAGSMLMVMLSEQELQPLLSATIALAAVNSASRCVVAGPTPELAALEQQLKAAGVSCRPLHTSHAFHSPMMEPILEPFLTCVRRIRLEAPRIPYISNVTGDWISADQVTDPSYWVQHLRQTVRFADGLHTLLQEPDRLLLEVGPGQTLATFARQLPHHAGKQTVLASLRHPQEQGHDLPFMLTTLGQLWLNGVQVDWEGFHAGERRHRIPLPTYPFERQRYWVEPDDDQDAEQLPLAASTKNADLAEWFYLPSWKRSVMPALEAGSPTPQESGTWLVFTGADPLSADVVAQLRRAGQTVATVAAGTHYAQTDPHTYSLDPAQPADYQALIKALAQAPLPLRNILHLWNVLDDGVRGDPAYLERSQQRGFYSLLFLAQALGLQPQSAPVRIGVASTGMQQVMTERLTAPEKATLLGPVRIIPQEYPSITCQSVDLVLPAADDAALAELAGALIGEFAEQSREPVVAYRHGERWVQRYEPAPIRAATSQLRLRERGVYLITGGMGGIGLVLAEELARTVQARIALVGRSSFPERSSWEAWLIAHGVDDPTSRKIIQLQQLELLGADVLVLSADVADPAQAQAVVQTVREQFGAIHGLIHAAGVAGGGLIPLKTTEMAARVFAPKLQAVCALEQALAAEPLDILVLCSSVAALLGSVGQVDYCGANAFLDAYAHAYQAEHGSYAVSINWDAWTEVGMAVHAAAAYGLHTGGPAHATELSHPLLDQTLPVIAGRHTYLTRLDPAKQWVLDEHRIMDVPTMPGTAYVEMVRAAYEHASGNSQAELRNIFFLAPLMINEGEQREVRTLLEESGGELTFQVHSRIVAHHSESVGWQEHVRGTIRPLAGDQPSQHAIQELRAACTEREITIDPDAVRPAEQFVFWGPRWMSLRNAAIGKGVGLALIELPSAFADDLANLILHPALLDVATTIGSSIIATGDNYLPLSYNRLRVYGALPARFYSYIRHREQGQDSREVIGFDITIMDEQGLAVAEIDGFMMKRVGAAAERLREQIQTDATDTPSGGHGLAPDVGMSEQPSLLAAPIAETALIGIAPAEGAEAFRRILSRVRSPQVAVVVRDLPALMARSATHRQAGSLQELEQSQATRAAHPRPELMNAYTAPRSDDETAMAQIWQQVLGIDQIGINDNFFELGGDSVLGIQILAKATAIGFQLAPAQIFQHQTVSELIAAIPPRPSTTVAAASRALAPLLPMQHYLLEQYQSELERRAHVLVLELHQPLDQARLDRALRQVVRHHEALGLCFTRTPDGWRQGQAPTSDAPLVRSIDGADWPADDQQRSLAASIADLQASCDLARGPLLQLALIERHGAAPDLLVLLGHPILVDGSSLPIILEDLWTVYDQLSRGEAPALPPKTAAFTQWIDRSISDAQRPATLQDAEHWLSTLSQPAPHLPQQGDLAAGSAAAPVEVLLSGSETRALVEGLAGDTDAHVTELLLAALAWVIAQWTGEAVVLLDLERHDRADLPLDIDLGRTVGQFAVRFPLRIDLSEAYELPEALRAVKEQLHTSPHAGRSYGLLRYIGADAALAARLRDLPQPELAFSYLGNHDQAVPAAAPFAAIPTPCLPRPRSTALELAACVVGGQLQLRWSAGAAYRQADLAYLAELFTDTLRQVLTSGRSSVVSAADFAEAGLDQAQLEQFLATLRTPPRE